MAKRGSAAKQSQAYLFNVAAVGVGATTLLLAMFGTKTKEVVALCSERYGVATEFALQRGAGAPASAAELQSSLGGRDWGVIENASVVKTPDGPGQFALHVNLPKPPAAGGPTGLGFTWLQPSAEPAQTACLSYQVMVPKDFEFGEGGALPGVFGGDTSAAPKDDHELVKSSFGTQAHWVQDGRLVMRIATASDTGMVTYEVVGRPQPTLIDRGRWVPIEQEIVLNTEGQYNGLLRVWVDGHLRLEKTDIAWRTGASGIFRGVDVRAQYWRGPPEAGSVPAATSLRIAPIDIRWR